MNDDGVTKVLTDYKKTRPWWHYLPPITVLLVVRAIVTWLLGSWIMDLIHIRGGLDYWEYQTSRGDEKKAYKTLLEQKKTTLPKSNDLIRSTSGLDGENTNQSAESGRKFKLYHPNGAVDFYVKRKKNLAETEDKKFYFVHFNNAGDKYNGLNLPKMNPRFENSVDIFVNHTGSGSILFDHRRHNMEDLYLTGEVVIHHLLHDLKIPEEKIIVRGWSLGSVVAAKVVKRFQNKGNKIKLISDRSFTTILDLLLGLCGRGSVDAWKRTGKVFFWHWGVCAKTAAFIFLCIYSLTVTALCLAGALIAIVLVPPIQRLTGTTISGGWDFHQVDQGRRLAFESTSDHFVNPPAKLSWSLFRNRGSKGSEDDGKDIQSNNRLGHFNDNTGREVIPLKFLTSTS